MTDKSKAAKAAGGQAKKSKSKSKGPSAPAKQSNAAVENKRKAARAKGVPQAKTPGETPQNSVEVVDSVIHTVVPAEEDAPKVISLKIDAPVLVETAIESDTECEAETTPPANFEAIDWTEGIQSNSPVALNLIMPAGHDASDDGSSIWSAKDPLFDEPSIDVQNYRSQGASTKPHGRKPTRVGDESSSRLVELLKLKPEQDNQSIPKSSSPAPAISTPAPTSRTSKADKPKEDLPIYGETTAQASQTIQPHASLKFKEQRIEPRKLKELTKFKGQTELKEMAKLKEPLEQPLWGPDLFEPDTNKSGGIKNRRSSLTSSAAAFQYLSALNKDEDVKVRDSDRFTSLSLLVAVVITFISLLLPQLESHRLAFVLLSDLLLGVMLVVYVLHRFGILSTLSPRQALLTWQLMIGAAFLGIFITINVAIVIGLVVAQSGLSWH